MPEKTKVTSQNEYPIDIEHWQSLQGQEITLPWSSFEVTAKVGTVIPVNERHGNPIYDFKYYIVLLELGPPPEGSNIDPVDWAKMDANIWILPHRNEFGVNGATRVQKVIDNQALFMMQVLHGKGSYLTTGIDSLPRTTTLDSKKVVETIYAKRGDIVCLIAEPRGMLVLGLNYPAFDPSQETQHSENGPKDRELYSSTKDPDRFIWKINNLFWKAFRKLRLS